MVLTSSFGEVMEDHFWKILTLSDDYWLVWFGLVSLLNGISTLFRLFNAKAILLEEQ